MARFQTAKEVVKHFLNHAELSVVDCGDRVYEIHRVSGRISLGRIARYKENELLSWAASWED
jgi:hypothetical protein